MRPTNAEENRIWLMELRRQHDQASEPVRIFMERQKPEDLIPLLQKYVSASHGSDEEVALDAILAAYGLLTAMLRDAEQGEPEPTNDDGMLTE